MAHWIFIEEGFYPLEEAFLITPSYTATILENAIMDVYLDNKEERRVRGSGMAISVHIVEMLEDHDDIDLIMDLGEGFMYLVKDPVIKSGKVFTPDVKSQLQFQARGPLQKLNGDEYRDIRSKLHLIGNGA